MCDAMGARLEPPLSDSYLRKQTYWLRYGGLLLIGGGWVNANGLVLPAQHAIPDHILVLHSVATVDGSDKDAGWMTQNEWEKAAADLAAKHAARRELSLAHLRQSLIEVDRLLRNAPTSVQQRYKTVSEVRLRVLADKAQAKLDDGSMAWLAHEPVEAAAAQARALDRYLSGC